MKTGITAVMIPEDAVAPFHLILPVNPMLRNEIVIEHEGSDAFEVEDRVEDSLVAITRINFHRSILRTEFRVVHRSAPESEDLREIGQYRRE